MLLQKRNSYHSPFLCCLFLVVFALSAVRSQSDSTSLQKIENLKTKPNFDFCNTEYIDLLYQLAIEMYDSNKDSMFLLINEGLDLSLKSDYKNGEGFGYMRFGNYYAMTADNKKADIYYKRAIVLAEKHELFRLKAITLNNYGIGLNEIGDNANALIKFLEGIDLAKKIEFYDLLPVLYDNVAGLHAELNDYETSLSFHKKAIELNKKSGNEELHMRTLSVMAKSYASLNDYENAEKALHQAMPYLLKHKKRGWLGYCYRVKGIIAYEKGAYKTALEWYTKGKEIFDSYDDFHEAVFVLDGMAKSYLALNQVEKARVVAIKANNKANQANFLEGIVFTTNTLNHIYEKKGDYEKAWQFQNEHIKNYKKQNEENFKNGLAMIKHKMVFENEKKELMSTNIKVLAKQRNYVYLALIALGFLIIVLLLLYRNYSIQRKFNQELKQRETELKQSNQTKDKLFSIIAHDLKGPIASFYEIMKLYTSGDVSKEESQLIFPQALNDLAAVNDMLNNLLVWGKTQIQGEAIKLENVNVHNYINENISLLQSMAEKKSIAIKNETPENLICYCDKDHVDIVLRNLISNAIKFTNSRGTIWVAALHLENELQIAVHDNGVGMNEQTRENLFSNKEIESTYGTNHEKGTGLGLSLCKELIENNSGKIWVKSQENEGTSIFFTLPKRRIFQRAV